MKKKTMADMCAKSKGISLPEAMKRAFFDSIEEESDLVEAKTLSEKIRNGIEATCSIDEVDKMLCM